MCFEVKKLSDVPQTPRKFRKKPVVIKAVKLLEKVKIHTREGTLYGEEGEYLIEGVEGEVYPCKPDIFWKTYEEVTSVDSSQQQ